jgi:hypothetical protein
MWVKTNQLINQDLLASEIYKFLYTQFPTDKITIDQYNKIKNNDEYLTFISENGYKWFLENGTIDANVKILTEIIDFKLLK